ncbi:MAG: hypothetical protein AB8G11_23150 [Saprospiraceae bacterium]
MISVDTIDTIAEEVSELTAEQIAIKLDDIKGKQPSLFAYLMSDNETYLFSQAEKELLYYMAFVIWEAIKKERTLPQRLSLKQVDAIQFDNWKQLENYTNPKGQPLDEFFESEIGYHTEAELMYFVCDALEDSDDMPQLIAKDSLLPMFVMMKTFVDCLIIEN